MSKLEENIIINYTKEIKTPNDYSQLREDFINNYNENSKKNFVFFIKNNLDNIVPIKEGESIKEFLKDKDKIIYVKEIENTVDNFISLDLNKTNNAFISINIKNSQKTPSQNENEREYIKENEELIEQINKLKYELEENIINMKNEVSKRKKIEKDIIIMKEKMNNQIKESNKKIESLEKEKLAVNNLLKEKENSMAIVGINNNQLNKKNKDCISEKDKEKQKLLKIIDEQNEKMNYKIKENEKIINILKKENEILNNN